MQEFCILFVQSYLKIFLQPKSRFFEIEKSMNKKLYFIALIPPEDIERSIHTIKEEIAEKYDSKKALKLPAHITLEPPFKLSEKEEHKVCEPLKHFAENQKPIQVHLMNFGAFTPRTIFLKVKNQESVMKLHENLQQELKKSNFKKEGKKEQTFHPHMTVAFRDLEKEQFKAAWADFQNRKFETSFFAKKVFLLKHNGKIWEVYKAYNFH